MAPDRERLVYLFGEEALDELEDYELGSEDDESDVIEVIDRFLPPLPPGPQLELRQAMRTIAVRQLLSDDLPHAWRAVLRMREAGLNRDEVLGNLMLANSGHIFEIMESNEAVDPARLEAALDALPVATPEAIVKALVSVAREQPGIDVGGHFEQTLDRLGSTAARPTIEPLIDDLIGELLNGPMHYLPDDRVLPFFDTIAGRTFTHRLDELEREMQFLPVSFDLAAFARFDAVRVADGREIEIISLERGYVAWQGPEGWLDEFQPGDLLAVTAAFDPPTGADAVEATITVTVVQDPPEVSDEMVDQLRVAYEAGHHESGLPVAAIELVMWLCHHHTERFTTAMVPLTDWCAAAGFTRRGAYVAHDDETWRRDLAERQFFRAINLIEDRDAQLVLGQAFEVLGDPNASADDVRESLAACAEPEMIDLLAQVFIPEDVETDVEAEDETAVEGINPPGDVFAAVALAVDVARRPREVATAEYLACVLRERCGQPLIAAEHLTRAANAQPRLGPVIERMGWYAFDRGDARGAMRWWGELSTTHSAASTLAPFLGTVSGGPKLGRNDPCWCGSGRKFKQCHQNSTELPALPERVGWLIRKAILWMEHRLSANDLMTELAIAWIAGDPDADADDLDVSEDELGALFAETVRNPVLLDVALHEGGLFAQFLRERGELLPEDEQLVAASWRTIARSVHEVVEVDPGRGMTLRNLGTGDVIEVSERSASKGVAVGECYCARVAPVGDLHQVIGGVFDVRTGQESDVLALCDLGDPFELCAWAGGLSRPPRVEMNPGMLESMLDGDALQAAMADGDEDGQVGRLMAEMRRQLQSNWLDESVPALAGLTPRQAAADPTRREQLERLLAEFERMDERVGERADEADDEFGVGLAFDVAELRRELGLS